MIKDFVKDTVKYLPCYVVPGIVGFISIPIVTRLFLPADYGNYSLVVAAVTVLTALIGWLSMSIVRFYPAYERDKKLNIFYGTTVKLLGVSILIITAGFWFILLLIKGYLSPKLYALMYVGLGSFVLTSIFGVFQSFLVAKRTINWLSGFAVWKSIMGFGFGILLIFSFELNVEGLLWGVILSIIFVLPLSWRKAAGKVTIARSGIDSILTRDMARYGFPLVAGNLAAWILSLSDRYILEFFWGTNEVGIYSAGYNISAQTTMLVVDLFLVASTPILMNIWENRGKAESKEFVFNLTRYYLIWCIPAVIGLSVLAKPVMSVLTGQQYQEGYRIIPFVAVGILFLGLQHRFQSGFLVRKKTGFITLAIVVSGLLNVILNLLFIPKHGYMAAGVTTLISYVFLLFLMIIISRRIFIWSFPFRSMVNSVCASGVMGVAVYFVSKNLIYPDIMKGLISLIVSACVGVVVYLLTLILLKELSQEEIQMFHFLKRKILK